MKKLKKKPIKVFVPKEKVSFTDKDIEEVAAEGREWRKAIEKQTAKLNYDAFRLSDGVCLECGSTVPTTYNVSKKTHPESLENYWHKIWF